MSDFSFQLVDVFKDKEHFKEGFRSFLEFTYGKKLEDADQISKYTVLSKLINTYIIHNWEKNKSIVSSKGYKEVYYFSLEFLLGRMLKNNLKSIGVYEVVKEGLLDLNIDINDLENIEADAGLGNGGLGRLAACFLDSLASLNYPGNGNTIRYKNGLFKQLIINNKQVEVPDQWLKLGYPWEIRKPERAVTVKFYGDVNVYRDYNGDLQFNHINTEDVLAMPYDIPIIGYNTDCTNTLRMWSAEPSESVPEGRDYRKYMSDVDDICLNLYPDDSTEKGKYLRIKQEYFFVSAGLQTIIKSFLWNGNHLDDLANHIVIQLNDTHPALAIPELMRILMDEHNIPWAKAFDTCSKVFAYTNHTILHEALEKWPVEYIKKLLPRIYMIIEELDQQFVNYLNSIGKDHNFIESVRIISEGNVRMANLSIVGSFSVNGVASIHTEIIKNTLFRDFYSIMPEKFNNKTNGITPRRWLLYSNSDLVNLIEKYIGPDFKYDFNRISDLMNHVDNVELQKEFLEVKLLKKKKFAYNMMKDCGISLDPNTIFDVQAKRLHAYKRQLLNVLYIISLYNKIKEDPDFVMPKTTFIFGAKAASNYHFAKKVIELINCVAHTIDNDERVSKFIKVVFIPNYRVSIAERLMPATDVSEQISTAGKEASGTGNMKFMMNGAITLGTLDGANVEISELVGEENCVIFGLRADEVMQKNYDHSYDAYSYYKNDITIKKVIDRLVDGTFNEDKETFKDIADEFLLRNDEYYILADFEAYCAAHQRVYDMYADRLSWAKKCLINIAKSAYFSSDRTIEEYVRDIWHLEKIK